MTATRWEPRYVLSRPSPRRVFTTPEEAEVISQETSPGSYPSKGRAGNERLTDVASGLFDSKPESLTTAQGGLSPNANEMTRERKEGREEEKKRKKEMRKGKREGGRDIFHRTLYKIQELHKTRNLKHVLRRGIT